MQSDPAHDELVEKMARAIAKAEIAYFGPRSSLEQCMNWANEPDCYRQAARAALAVARPVMREECARVALGEDASATEYYRGRVHAAAAIRAMIKERENDV